MSELDNILEEAEKEAGLDDVLALAEAEAQQPQSALESLESQLRSGTAIEQRPAEQEEFAKEKFANTVTVGLSDRLRSKLGPMSYEEIVKDREEKAKKYPGTDLAGDVLGAAASLPYGGGTGLLRSAALNTGIGAVGGAAMANPDEDPIQKGLEGGLYGAATSLTLGAGSAGIKKLGSKIKDKAEDIAEASLGLNTTKIQEKTNLKERLGQWRPKEITRFAKEEGILKSGSGSKEMLKKTWDKQSEIGGDLGKIVDTGTDIPIKPVVSNIRNIAEDAANAGDTKVAKHIHDYADTLEARTNTHPMPGSRTLGPKKPQDTITPAELKNLKTRLGKKTKFGKDDSDIVQAREEIYGTLSDSVEASLSPENKLKLKELNSKYEKLKTIEDGLSRESSKVSDMFGWQNLMLGTYGNVGVPIARELYKTYGKTFAAAGVRNPNFIAKNKKWLDAFKNADSSAAVAATIFKLQQEDKEFAKQVQNQQENDKKRIINNGN